MSMEMDKERISKWKCPECGSRHKKTIDNFNSNKKKIGYSIFCCYCGHVENFAWTIGMAKNFAGLKNNVVDACDVKCGLLEKDLEYCADFCCPYRPQQKPKGPSMQVRQQMADEPPKPEPPKPERKPNLVQRVVDEKVYEEITHPNSVVPELKSHPPKSPSELFLGGIQDPESYKSIPDAYKSIFDEARHIDGTKEPSLENVNLSMEEKINRRVAQMQSERSSGPDITIPVINGEYSTKTI